MTVSTSDSHAEAADGLRVSQIFALLNLSVVVLGMIGLPGYARQLLSWPPCPHFFCLPISQWLYLA